MSHSKRNTSLAFFTSHERALLRHSWGSQSARLTRDSFLPFASCRLCLQPAREPVACSSGGRRADLFCRECALNDLVAQRKEIKRLEREWEAREAERMEGVRKAREEEEKREVEKFERTAVGLDEAGQGDGNGDGGKGMTKGRKRKAPAEEEGEESLESADRQRQRVNGGEEKGKTEASFWVPGVDARTLNANTHATNKPIKQHPICPASSPSTKHTYSLKTLITVHFTDDHDSTSKESLRICPACKKRLANSSRAMLAKPCGHVLCGSCVDKFMKPPDLPHAHDTDGTKRHGRVLCYVCEADVTDRRKRRAEGEEKERIGPGLVEISCEGTGFAGGGANMTKKEGVTFQC